jgi:hypothetical protein
LRETVREKRELKRMNEEGSVSVSTYESKEKGRFKARKKDILVYCMGID